jgi:hypothetical protein
MAQRLLGARGRSPLIDGESLRSIASLDCWPRKRYAVLDHQPDALDGREISERIAVENEEVRFEAGLKAAHSPPGEDHSRTVQRPHAQQLVIPEDSQRAQICNLSI